MKNSFAITVLVLLFAAGSIGAQDNNSTTKKKAAEKTNNAPQQHSTPPAEHRQSSPQQSTPPVEHRQPVQQQPAPAVEHRQPVQQQSAPAVEHRQSTPPVVQQQHTTPPSQVYTPADRQNQRPVTQPAQTQQQQQQQQQPGRTFGRQPDGNRPPAVQNNTVPPRGTDRPVVERGGFGNARPSTTQVQPRVYQTPNGGMVRRNDAGRVTEVRTPSGAMIHHEPYGARRVEVVRPDGRVIVTNAGGHGYVQRQVIVNNTTIVKRTYVVRGVTYVNVYRPVTYGGVVLQVYTPVRYYRPGFYVYAYSPWSRPVVYNWGWAGRPWYGYYGGYFAPYPVYASPTLWLTDYLVAATLEAAYLDRMAAASAPPPVNTYAPGGPVALTPEVKQAIADEVRRQVDYERAQGQNAGMSGQSSMFSDNASHVFVAQAGLEVMSNAGPCIIGAGDVMQMNGAPPPNSTTADVIILASQGQDCRRGAVASVQLQDLQEMQNHMRETIDRGLGDLQTKQGQNGIPALPSGAAGTVDTAYASAAQPDAGAGSELTQVTREADRAEQDVLSQSQNAGPVTISLGQSIEDVTAIQGEPQKIVDLGSKKIYVYKDLKITFTDGKVSAVE